MRSLFIRAAIAASILGFSGTSFAQVVTSSPAPGGIPGKVPPAAGAATDYAVPAIHQPDVQATGTTGTASPSSESSAEIWQKAIATPPQGRISARSKTAMEKALVAAYEAGKTQNLPPIAGTNGEVLYAYGQSLPTLVTAPLHTSIIVLRGGMQNPKAVGLSPAYWQVVTLTAGNQPEMAITPRFNGLHGNLVVTGTSPQGKPMNYVIEVTSDPAHYTPMIGFYYPNAMVRTWKQEEADRQAFTQKVSRETIAALPSINAASLDFRWKMHCSGGGWFSSSDCRSIMPLRVFDDGKQTFIQFKPGQDSRGGIPSILAENAAGQNAIINTIYRDGYYIVDGVPNRIILLAGKGSNGKVVKLIHENH
ncbi:TrbG/VirB9 family P-type conjugative transfer protein [Acidithiobacillus ferrooxidans]|uniref:TrbG/VirB9 family P-type conjugative transfer protein n=1 Tax=Acidithiobacillus TaxID=119977 RepID=UPI000B0A5851|nr:TrbG/VirB9 family P-type conjugative transfer protein [Acidithiobacillus ferridurans]